MPTNRKSPFEVAALLLAGCGGTYGVQPACQLSSLKGESVVQLVATDREGVMVLLADGTVKLANKEYQARATELPELRGATTLVANSTCAIFADATLRCLHITTVARDVREVASGVREAATRFHQTCFIRADQSAACAADDGSELTELPLVGRRAAHIDASWDTVCVVADDTSLHCWKRALGRPGAEVKTESLGAPMANLPLGGIVQVSVGSWLTLRTNGRVEQGDFNPNTPQLLMNDADIEQPLEGLVSIASASALTADGHAYGYRNHVYGQDEHAPNVTGTALETVVVPDVSHLVSNTDNECGLRANGEVMCWGTYRVPSHPPPFHLQIRWNEQE